MPVLQDEKLNERAINRKRFFLLFFLLNILSILGASEFFLGRFLAGGGISNVDFLIWLFAIGFVNFLLLWFFWKIRSYFSKQAQLIAILWTGVVVCYLIFAPVFYLLTLSLDANQLALSGFIFSWEVPIIGALFISACALRFRKLNQIIYGQKEPVDPNVIYRDLERYKIEVIIILFLFSGGGYALGSLQLFYFADLPVLEQIKNIISGFVVAMILALFFFLVLNIFFRDARRVLETKFLIKRTQTTSISKRLFLKAAFTTIGTIAFLSLVYFQSWQDLIKQHVIDDLEQQMAIVLEDPLFDATLLNGDLEIYVLNKDEIFEDQRFSQLALAEINIRSSGLVEDMRGEHKVVSITRLPERNLKIIGIASISPHYDPLASITRNFMIGVIFVLFIAIMADVIIVYTIRFPVRNLMTMIRKADRGETDNIEEIYSGDEFALLFRSFRDYSLKLESLNQSKSEFLSLAAHELKNPLTVLSLKVDMMLNYSNLDREQKKELQEMKQIIKNMVSLIKDFWQVSRIEMGSLAVEPKRILMSEFVDNILLEFKDKINNKSLKVVKSIDESLSKKIKVDPEILRIIFYNLLSNSIKYTKEEGQLKINIYKKDQLHIELSDNGYGIPKKQQSLIFEKFFRGRNIADKNERGTGLGLYLTKKIVEQLNGTIGFKSKENKGTTFFVDIPLNE